MASAAAELIAKARRDIQHEFFSRDAVRPDRAIAFDSSRHSQRRVFERWKRAGVIREGSPGHHWLEVTAYDIDLLRRHNRVRIALLIVIVMLVAMLLAGKLAVH